MVPSARFQLNEAATFSPYADDYAALPFALAHSTYSWDSRAALVTFASVSPVPYSDTAWSR
jgi:hypothetical protein